MKDIILNNGIKMPQVGLGTFLIPSQELSRTIGEAYELGYRQFDTAWRYYNECDIAKALKEHGINREDVFITTKINADALYPFSYQYGKKRVLNVIRYPKSIYRAILESFNNLQTDYIDLFLVHWPWPIYTKLYKALTKLYKEGRIRAIGVSNCSPAHIEYLREFSDIVPALNQVEISPLNSQGKLVNWCQQNGIAVEAMSTFSHFRSVEPRKEILEDPTLLKIAHVKNKSVVQIVLRWLIQRDIIVIPKTWNLKHLQENIDIFDFQLSDEEMGIIDSLDTGKCYNYDCWGDQAAMSLPKNLRAKRFDF